MKPELIAELRKETAAEDLDLTWLEKPASERGINVKPGKRGLTVEEIATGTYGDIPRIVPDSMVLVGAIFVKLCAATVLSTELAYGVAFALMGMGYLVFKSFQARSYAAFRALAPAIPVVYVAALYAVYVLGQA